MLTSSLACPGDSSKTQAVTDGTPAEAPAAPAGAGPGLPLQVLGCVSGGAASGVDGCAERGCGQTGQSPALHVLLFARADRSIAMLIRLARYCAVVNVASIFFDVCSKRCPRVACCSCYCNRVVTLVCCPEKHGNAVPTAIVSNVFRRHNLVVLEMQLRADHYSSPPSPFLPRLRLLSSEPQASRCIIADSMASSIRPCPAALNRAKWGLCSR